MELLMATLKTKALLGIAFALGGCMFDADAKHDFGTTPEALDDGWAIATPEDVGLSRAALDGIHHELLREDRWFGSIGMLVIKDDKLVFETYVRTPADRDHVHHLQSATKSFTSVLFGIARDQGYVSSLDLSVGDLFPDKLTGVDPRTPSITLDQCFTMRSGINLDNSDYSVDMYVDKPQDPLHYILEQPLYANPGDRFYYRDADPQLVGYALRRLTGEWERDLALATLFPALGIRDYYWQDLPDGATAAPHGLHLRPRDLAKLGELVLERGTFQGQRVVSKEWLDLATADHTASNIDNFGYGYYFWVVPDVGVAAWGHGGQFVLVVPQKNMVLVHVALPDADLQGSQLSDFVELVRPLL
jgi:CubicO group peptidase (beta-lactamase class C family)